jgi:hypothetical protein
VETQAEMKGLLAAVELQGPERQAAWSLLNPEDGIALNHMGGELVLSYADGMHRAHALLVAGVRRTVVIRDRCCHPDQDC